MKTWNKEEIEASCALAYGMQFDTSALIGRLESPKPEFKVGEVVRGKASDSLYTFTKGHNPSLYRHLTPEEVPALALAIERLRGIAENDQRRNDCAYCDESQAALADIEAMTK